MNSEQLKQLEDDLWSAADNLRANTGLKPSEYATPVLGLIFLKFADNKYKAAEPEILKKFKKLQGKRTERKLSDIAIEICGFFLPDHARYQYLLDLPESADLPKEIKTAMKAIEDYKPELDGVLPKDEYFKFNQLKTEESRQSLFSLVRNFANIPSDASGDILGKIYEYFLGKFALSEGQGGGEFFTPTSVVRLMVEIIEPHKGTVYDPACGSGGMFVQSQYFVDHHRKTLKKLGESHDEDQLYVYGQEKTLDTVKLAKMNLAVNGLRGEIKQANSYGEDPFNGLEKFDYVMANPPFNVDTVPVATVENDARFNCYGLPRNKTKVKSKGQETVPNANYLWISLFATSLKPKKGRAALVMANSASDARHSEADIRKNMIEDNVISAMLTLPSNMFYTVTLPATLWFFDKNKQDDKILFIDTRNIFTPIDRAHREFSEEQVQNIAIINKLHKGQHADFVRLIDDYFAQGMDQLQENEKHVGPISEQLLSVLSDTQGKALVKDLVKQWKGLGKLQAKYDKYQESQKGTKLKTQDDAKARNKAQHKLKKAFEPFFETLHTDLKQIDKIVREHEKQKALANTNKRTSVDKETKQLKQTLELLHKEVKVSEAFFKHIHWLEERFPSAEYEDVTGLCKLASQEEIKEQDYSLNPGRYVGVVIEEDGKTEEEFVSDISDLNDELMHLKFQAEEIGSVVANNIEQLIKDIERVN